MTYVVLDFETTGLDYRTEDIIEIAAVRLDGNFNEVASFQTYVMLDKRDEVPEFITGLTGITNEDVDNGMWNTQAFNILREFIGGSTVVAQYAPFDLAFLSKLAVITPKRYICTKSLTAQAEPTESSSLGATCERLGIPLENAHRAMDDVRATVEVLKHRMKQDIEYVHNSIVVSPGRALKYIPKNTELILSKDGDIIVDYR